MPNHKIIVEANAPGPLPKISSICLFFLYPFLIWTIVGPIAILENANMELCLAKQRQAESISAHELAIERRPEGTHVSISNYSMTVSVSMGGKESHLSTGAEVKPEPPIPVGTRASRISAKLSANTAANVVNSGELSIGRLKPLVSHTVPLPPLDAIVVSSDAEYVKVVDTDGLMTYAAIMIRRVLAGLVICMGFVTLVAIVMIHRHRWKTAIKL